MIQSHPFCHTNVTVIFLPWRRLILTLTAYRECRRPPFLGEIRREFSPPNSVSHLGNRPEQLPMPRRYRTGWISDTHLGTRGCNATALLDFLRENDFETLYVVGDLIDIWSLRRGIYWPQQHNDVIQKILRKARKGTRVIYIPGNHDELVTSFLGAYGNIDIKENAVSCDCLRGTHSNHSRTRTGCRGAKREVAGIRRRRWLSIFALAQSAHQFRATPVSVSGTGRLARTQSGG